MPEALAEGSAKYALPLTTEGVVRLPPRLRERHLTEDVSEAVVQASGYHLRIWIWSDRDDIVLALPFDGFRAERIYERSIHRWGINVARWTTPGKTNDPDESLGWWNDAKLDRAYGGESNKEMIEATVRVHDGGEPDV